MTAGEKIDLLLRQKERIDDKQFDLASWKKTTSTLLEKIFGSADPRINTIEELKIDYGSWALRDASSTYDPVKTCKKKSPAISLKCLSMN